MFEQRSSALVLTERERISDPISLNLQRHTSWLAERTSAGQSPEGGVERPRRMVRFARLIHAARPRLLGRPSAGAAFRGSLSLAWSPRSVVGTTKTAGPQGR